jgi:hypothetical protein
MSYDAKHIWFSTPAESTPQIKKAIRDFWDIWLPMHSRKDNLLLYHYTTLEGLKGILKNRSIWFTHTSTLNDPLELKYGKNLILDILNKAINKKDDPIINQLLNALVIQINSFDDVIYEAYVACFCESDNLLSQWRGYGHRGGGYNIGFEFTSDTKFYHLSDPSEDESYVILRKIIYDFDKQKELVSKYLSLILINASRAIDHYKNHGGLPEIWGNMAAIESSNILSDLMLSFKSPVFKEENEWRLILVRQPEHKLVQLKFRENSNGLIPYIETYIIEKKENRNLFPIHSIRFGPMLDVSRTKSALNLYLRKEAVSENNIRINGNCIRILDAGYLLREQ